jgi:hypothetical protein
LLLLLCLGFSEAVLAKIPAAQNKIQKACIDHFKSPGSDSKDKKATCQCIARNHQANTSPEDLSLIERRYKDANTEADLKKESVSLLWELDQKIADACLKDPQFKLIKIDREKESFAPKK